MGARIDDRWQYHGLRTVRLENARLAVDVLPELGGKILRLIDKRGDRDLLWHSPRVEPHRGRAARELRRPLAGGMGRGVPGRRAVAEPLRRPAAVHGRAVDDGRVLPNRPRLTPPGVELELDLTDADHARPLDGGG
jgi:hypothetical protein